MAWKWLRKRGPHLALKDWTFPLGACMDKLSPTLPTSPPPAPLGRPEGEPAEKEDRGTKMVLRAAPSGQRVLAGYPLPPLTKSRSCRASRPKVPGSGRGCTVHTLCGRLGLRKRPGLAGDQGGGLSAAVSTLLLQTLFCLQSDSPGSRLEEVLPGSRAGLWCGLDHSTRYPLRVSACPLVSGLCPAGGCRLQNRNCQ